MSPRGQGIREHLERVRLFVRLADEVWEPNDRYRIQIAAIYSCRAICELMLEAATKQDVRAPGGAGVPADRAVVEEWLVPRIRHYMLIERIRIHDFHRFDLTPPRADRHEMRLGGPIKLHVRKGSASLFLASEGAQTATSGNSAVELQRPLEVWGGRFRDDGNGQWKTLGEILAAFLEDAPNAIDQFEALAQ